MEARLQNTGVNPPIRLLLLHGWSPGPNLPNSIDQHRNLFDVREIGARGINDIACNRFGFLLVATVIGTCICISTLVGGKEDSEIGALNYILIALTAVCGVALSLFFKRRAVRLCISQCVAEMVREVSRFQPDAVVGYSWGGATAAFAVSQRRWLGPTLLLAPAQGMLASHAAMQAPNLNAACRSGARVKIVHGTHDPVVPLRDSEKLAATAQDEAEAIDLLVTHDDHFLMGTATPHSMAQWIVDLCAASNSARGQSQEAAAGEEKDERSSAAVGLARRQDYA
jgi:hypothetical protein